jgi:hypothetical protein
MASRVKKPPRLAQFDWLTFVLILAMLIFLVVLVVLLPLAFRGMR